MSVQRAQHETIAAKRDDHFGIGCRHVAITFNKLATRLLGNVGFAGDESKAHKIRLCWVSYL
jgi:hypothetical protein